MMKKALKDYLELTKPRITLLVTLTTLAGFLLASEGRPDRLRLFWTLLGTGLVAGATGCLNQLMEINEDRRMLRTRSRPLPQGRLRPVMALLFGVGCAVLGGLVLALRVNGASCALAAFTLLSYLLIYTPLKSRTPWAAWAGAVPGAMPPLIGCVAVGKPLGWEALALCGIQFFWQIPHFLSLAVLYKEDYARAGFQTAGVTDPEGKSTARQIAVSSAILLAVSLLPCLFGRTGGAYLFSALGLGVPLLITAAATARSLTKGSRQNKLTFLDAAAPRPAALRPSDTARPGPKTKRIRHFLAGWLGQKCRLLMGRWGRGPAGRIDAQNSSTYFGVSPKDRARLLLYASLAYLPGLLVTLVLATSA